MSNPLHEMKLSDIFFQKTEFLHNNWHYPPGWFFPDEDLELMGPFLDKDQAIRAWHAYRKRLLEGTLPSQTGISPLDS